MSDKLMKRWFNGTAIEAGPEQQWFDAAMKTTEQTEATKLFNLIVGWRMGRFGLTTEEAEETAKHDLGYFAAYFSSETRERVERLFDCAHPIFGKISVNGQPTAAEAFKAGFDIMRREKEAN